MAELARRRREFFEPSLPKRPLNLLDLSNEILEEIFYCLPAKTICRDVHLVCQRLYNTSRTLAFWTAYLRETKKFVPISNRIVDTEPWKRAFEFEHEEIRWQTNRSLYRYRSAAAHSASVDALTICETPNGARIAVSGARDRSMALWDLKNVAKNEEDKSTWYKLFPAMHETWIWTISISEDGKSVFSGGFDSMLKQWEIVDGSIIPIRQYDNNNSAVLKCILEDNLIYAATNNGRITVADVRIGLEPQRVLELPRNNGLACMKSMKSSNNIYTVSSQSGNLFRIDKRQMRVMQKSSSFRQCSSIDLNEESLVASWKSGTVKYLNPENLKTEYTWECKSKAEVKNTSPICLSKGAFVYGHSYEVMVYTPGRTPRLLDSFPTKDMVISVDYKNGDMACGMSEGVVMFWPRENQSYPFVDLPQNNVNNVE